MQRWKLKSRLCYRYVQGDVEWNPTNTLRYPAICFFAGFFAGLFGVGGGIVKGPLMLEMGRSSPSLIQVSVNVEEGRCVILPRAARGRYSRRPIRESNVSES